MPRECRGITRQRNQADRTTRLTEGTLAVKDGPAPRIWCRPILSLQPISTEIGPLEPVGRTEKLSRDSSHKMYFIATHDLFRRFGSYPLLRFHQRESG